MKTTAATTAAIDRTASAGQGMDDQTVIPTVSRSASASVTQVSTKPVESPMTKGARGHLHHFITSPSTAAAAMTYIPTRLSVEANPPRNKTGMMIPPMTG